MDMSLVSAVLGAQTGATGVTMAADLIRMSADSANAIVKLLDAANQNANPLANVGHGIGTKLDISA
jgi:hypothetical protein